MISVLLGTGLNIILDPILIFGLNMGVSGAAVATVISQAMSCIWVLFFLCSKRGIIRLKKKCIRFNWEVLRPALLLGLSPFVQIITESLTSLCFNRSLLKYGGDAAVGAMTIFAIIMQFVSLPITGIAQGAQPIISYNYGAGKYNRVGKCCRLVLFTSLFYSFFFWVLIHLFPDVLLRIFAEDHGFIEYSISVSGYFFAMLWVMGAQISCQLMFVALGNAKVSLFLALLRKVFLLIPLIFIMPHIFTNSAQSVFLAEPIADTFACITTVIFFVKEYRKMFFLKRNNG